MNLFSRVINFVNISILIYRRRANVCANPVGGIRSVCYLNGDKIIRHKGLCNGLGGSPASHRGDLGSKTVQSLWGSVGYATKNDATTNAEEYYRPT